MRFLIAIMGKITDGVQDRWLYSGSKTEPAYLSDSIDSKQNLKTFWSHLSFFSLKFTADAGSAKNLGQVTNARLNSQMPGTHSRNVLFLFWIFPLLFLYRVSISHKPSFEQQQYHMGLI
jgi:hypothetical protein